ncbi:MAG: hypothetical protein H7Z37_17985 [Pyrinomonadaceae bacterium]|nr:hypothetical protein [Pyrinomonadaceae bacterium]
MKREKNTEAGFAYIDVMVAILILMVGMLGMVAAMTASLRRTFETEQQLIAKQFVQSTVESIFAARDIQRNGGAIRGWDSIGNVGQNIVGGTPQGIFLTGLTPIRVDAGPDGVIGTSDDSCAAPTACPSGTGVPNSSTILTGYERQIAIVDVDDPERPSPVYAIKRRNITVTVRYRVGQTFRQETTSTVIADLLSQ